MSIKTDTREMKLSSPLLAASSEEKRNEALKCIANALLEKKEEIFAANKIDVDYANTNGVAPSIIKRLVFTEAKLNDCIKGINDLIGLNDPLGQTKLKRALDDDLILESVTVPIGVIGIIFEARPDALVQISSLCIKSGNCAILKGGKETANTNKVLFDIIKSAAVASGLPEKCMLLAQAHSEIDELLSCDEYVDLLIPRGSNNFVRYIQENTKIPVLGHSSGICHTYLDKDFDLDKTIKLVVDAKIQYAAACNATETLLINRAVADGNVTAILAGLTDADVKLKGTKEIADKFNSFDIDIMSEDEFDSEYNDYIISIKYVDDVAEAVNHINKFGSHHTDCIITEDKSTADYFLNMVDSASVYHNASTRFADGFRYGFGAEVGISTGKIHARGPVGLDGLVTYKYKLSGDYNIVGDYASGAKTFKHKDL